MGQIYKFRWNATVLQPLPPQISKVKLLICFFKITKQLAIGSENDAGLTIE